MVKSQYAEDILRRLDIIIGLSTASNETSVELTRKRKERPQGAAEPARWQRLILLFKSYDSVTLDLGCKLGTFYGRPAQQMRTLYFCPVSSFLFFFFFPSPNLSG